MYGTTFTEPTGRKVLEKLFDNDAKRMYGYACAFRPGIGGPYDLGLEFRQIVKKVNRTSWWGGCKRWLEEQGIEGEFKAASLVEASK